MLCFRKLLVANFLWIRGGGGGLSRFPVENFLSQSAQKIYSGTLLCCVRKLLVAKKFTDKRWGGVSGPSVDNFLPYSAEQNS